MPPLTERQTARPDAAGSLEKPPAGGEAPVELLTPDPVETSPALEGARLGALQAELHELRVCRAAKSGNGIPHLTLHFSEVAGHSLLPRGAENRFRIPQHELSRALDRFCADPTQMLQLPRTMVIVAHPDDESIGAGARLAHLDEVFVVHVTDGSRSDPEHVARYGFSNPTDYGAARRREAREALALAGVPEERMICLGIPDGEVSANMMSLVLRVTELIERYSPEVVVTQPYEGGHTDHDAIALIVQLACGVLRREGVETPVILELTAYHNRHGHRVAHQFLPVDEQLEIRTLALSPSAQKLKRRMYACFATQQECLRQFSVKLERFRPAPRYDFFLPPHDGVLDYELRCSRLSGEEWRKQARKIVYSMRSRRRGRISMLTSTGPSEASSSSVLTTEM